MRKDVAILGGSTMIHSHKSKGRLPTVEEIEKELGYGG
jgi:hypothetical protein